MPHKDEIHGLVRNEIHSISNILVQTVPNSTENASPTLYGPLKRIMGTCLRRG
jgi:hypothetical protein